MLPPQEGGRGVGGDEAALKRHAEPNVFTQFVLASPRRHLGTFGHGLTRLDVTRFPRGIAVSDFVISLTARNDAGDRVSAHPLKSPSNEGGSAYSPAPRGTRGAGE